MASAFSYAVQLSALEIWRIANLDTEGARMDPGTTGILPSHAGKDRYQDSPGMLRHADSGTTLDLYTHAIDRDQLVAQNQLMEAIMKSGAGEPTHLRSRPSCLRETEQVIGGHCEPQAPMKRLKKRLRRWFLTLKKIGMRKRVLRP